MSDKDTQNSGTTKGNLNNPINIHSDPLDGKIPKDILVSYGKGAKKVVVRGKEKLVMDKRPVTVTLHGTLERIRTGESKAQVLKIRELHTTLKGKVEEEKKAEGEEKKAAKRAVEDAEKAKAEAKKKLTYTLYVGKFDRRAKAGLKKASGLAILDFDHLDIPGATKKMLFDRVAYILSVWDSPSGDGLKALARIPEISSDAEYKLYYNAMLEDLKRFSVTGDKSTKDISRMCFDSYDPDILIKDWNFTEVFDKKVVTGKSELINGSPTGAEITNVDVLVPTDEIATGDAAEKLFNALVRRIMKSGGVYLEGRHEFLMRVVKDCIKYGIEQEATFSMVQNAYTGNDGDLPADEVDRVLNELWRTHYSEEVFGSEKLWGSPTAPTTQNPRKNPVQRAVEYLNLMLDDGDVLFNTMNRELVIRDGIDVESLYIQMRKSGQSINITDLTMLLEKEYAISYDPITQYFESLLQKYTFEEVNGSITELCRFVSAKNDKDDKDNKHDKLFDSMLRKHLIRCVGQGRGELINRFIFVLQQEQQYTGKSEFLRYLNPFGKELYTETIDEQNQILTLSQSFMINIEELEAFNKKDVNALKALISKGHDQVRKLYTQVNTTYKRKASFWGSTNKVEFLDDSTNTRWLIMRIESINFDYNNWYTGEGVNIEKVWAEAAHLWKQDASTQPTTEEWKLLEAINKEFTFMNDHDHWVAEYLSFGDEKYKYLATPTEIAAYLRFQVTSATPQKTGAALQKAGFKRGRKQKGGIRVNGFYVKTKSGESIKTGGGYEAEDDESDAPPEF